MSEKVEFTGDVGQAVMGDVKEAPRLSNVVNLNLNEVKKEVQLITDYQRKRINILVKEWAAICGDKELDIYKVFITDFGLRKFRQLPIEHYLTVKATLESWIASGSKGAATPSLPTGQERGSASQDQPHCPACAEKGTSLASARRMNFAQWILIAVLVATCAWLLYKMPPGDFSLSSDVQQCVYEGRSYTVGSNIKSKNGSASECFLEKNVVRWRQVAVSGTKREHRQDQ